MDTPRALAEALLVNLRVGEAASAAVVQLDDHGLFRFVAHDSSPGAEPAQAASERPEVAELPSQPDELTVGREGPEHRTQGPRVHDITVLAPCRRRRPRRHRLPECLFGLTLGIGTTHDPSPSRPDPVLTISALRGAPTRAPDLPRSSHRAFSVTSPVASASNRRISTAIVRLAWDVGLFSIKIMPGANRPSRSAIRTRLTISSSGPAQRSYSE